MSDHAKLSPSARHRWGSCPGSVREEAKFPEPPSGPSAIDGTHSHTLLETCIKNKLADPMDYIGVEMEDHEGKFTVDQDRAQRVKVAIDYIKKRVAEETIGSGFTPEVISEERVDPSWLLRRDDLYGTVDVQIWGSKVYEIIDYKDGMGVVEAKDNPQLEQYAYGVLSRFKLNPLEPYPFDTVRMTIIQPKLAFKGMQAITSHDVPVNELLARMHIIQEQAALTDDPNAPLVPGDEQCKFCRAKGTCTALASKSMEGVGLMFGPIMEQVDLAQQSADKDPSKMSDDQIRQVLESAPLIRQFIEGVEAEALRRLQSGIPVPGFKLVRGRGSRAWALPEDEIVKKLVAMGIPKKEVYETKLISPAKVEKIVWEKKDGTKVRLSDRQLKKLNEEYVTFSSGKLTVVPESDPREAVVTDAASMFSAIPQTPEPVAQVEVTVPSFLQPVTTVKCVICQLTFESNTSLSPNTCAVCLNGFKGTSDAMTEAPVEVVEKPEPPKLDLPAWML